MRILQIRFKNLNSLVGEWKIDFTHRDFLSDGIFAITGPTGSGKTTILDAICLALYAQTPRLGKIIQNNNEIFSRQTGESFAEVTFETQNGRFRCHWSQHRSRKKANGDLQKIKHEISELDTGKVLEDNSTSVVKKIAALTGMDFEQFTRAMLLAQGGFAAFLHAKPDDRAPILEKITGVEIYTTISVKVHERNSEEKRKLELLQSGLSTIELLSDEELQRLNKELLQTKNESIRLKQEEDQKTQFIDWLKTISILEDDLKQVNGRLQNWKERFEALTPSIEKLRLAEIAQGLLADYLVIAEKRRDLNEDRKSFQSALDDTSLNEQQLERTKKQFQLVETDLQKLESEQKETIPKLQMVRELDLKTSEKMRPIRDIEESMARLKKSIGKPQFDFSESNEIWTERIFRLKMDRDQAETDLQLKQNERKQCLGNLEIVDWRNQLDQLKEQKNGLTLIKDLLETFDHYQLEIDDLIDKQGSLKPEIETQSQKIPFLEENAKNLERQLLMLKRIESFEEHRKELEDGKPCPLCGAVEHPFAMENVPTQDETMIAVTEARKQLKSESDLLTKRTHDLANLQKEFLKTEKLKLDCRKKAAAILSKIKPNHEFETLAESLHDWITENEQSLQTTSELLNLATEVEQQIQKIRQYFMETKDAIVSAEKEMELIEQQQKLNDLRAEQIKLLEKRRELFADQSPDEEEKRLQWAIETGKKNLDLSRQKQREAAEQYAALKNRVEELEKTITRKTGELKLRENTFLARSVATGFASENDFLAAHIPEEQREHLKKLSRELITEQTELEAKKRETSSLLETECGKKLTEADRGQLDIERNNLAEKNRESQQQIGGILQKLEEDQKLKQHQQEKLNETNIQKKICERWNLLYQLIGSSDGKKFRVFAQGLTFEMMIGYANRQLQKMYDRYLLVRDESEQLELNVIDNDQAGEIRSTKNLSGGESFIISLALALGLSQMTSEKVRIESLFLDEGFGTLDEEALDAALETLARLKQDGKLIGVISHVPALKERIGTQIRVHPLFGGTSRITGPGVEKMESNRG